VSSVLIRFACREQNKIFAIIIYTKFRKMRNEMHVLNKNVPEHSIIKDYIIILLVTLLIYAINCCIKAIM
jgi:hypothetical protein